MTVREAMDLYREWNRDKFREEVISAGSLSPEEKWQQYLELVEFCRALKAEQNPYDKRQAQQDWQNYYTSIQKFEEKRKAHAEGTSPGTPQGS